jgi:hypothetical protein
MKIQKEHVFVILAGLFLLSYLLENIVTPLHINLTTPYSYLNPAVFSKYPFTTVVVIIRALSLFMVPLFLHSFLPGRHFAKVGFLLIIGSLAQLYSLQQLISGTTLIPLEWAISLSIAGALLIIPTVLEALQGFFHLAKAKIGDRKISFENLDDDEVE